MRVADHPALHCIWQNAEGICLEKDDSRQGIARYLSRNRGLCFIALADRKVVGTVLCGHDGRRGILRHLAVVPAFRNRGIGRTLAQTSLRALAKQGIRRCNVFVMTYNHAGEIFWARLGFVRLKDDYMTLQKTLEG
jgi:ribosomal protein S18 acetylase RimI-like enzyme